MKEQRLCVSQEVNSACNVTHATLLLGLHQLAQCFQNQLFALSADPAKGLALHYKNESKSRKDKAETMLEQNHGNRDTNLSQQAPNSI